uniref:Uncharacterized protein n=1 Tax=Hyaloperonospora arabidopsidis (strain Emoy2) TaxID=559515 RepID=M4B4E8_HYAAE
MPQNDRDIAHCCHHDRGSPFLLHKHVYPRRVSHIAVVGVSWELRLELIDGLVPSF